ncbi:amidase [Arboricoccus pini]|uniref:Amidase n=1 Tax=Arboricoccus pini TaxID=1963835 RepID=A0A212RLU9_9PROT|nr:amidase [Arboricoccus pini]SNB73303.1 amidase [Arboricoccus pini]
MTADLIGLYTASDALGLAEKVKRKEVKATELAEVAIGLIEAIDPQLNAVPLKLFELARERAVAPGDGLFAGVPFLLKDIGSLWKGTPLTAGLAYRRDYVCQIDTAMVTRMKEAGLVPLGRSNVPENGWCIATEPPAYGPTLNPWNPAVTPGGSSGGSAAAVAARLVPLGEATDGGGSIRVPASCCGILGLKPSRGRISYAPYADFWHGSVYSLAVTRSVRDTAAFLDATAINLPGDPYTPPVPDGTWLASIATPKKRLRIGYTTKAPWGPPLAPEVMAAMEAMITLLKELGHELVPHDMAGDLEGAWSHYNDVIAVETVLGFEELAKEVGRPVRQDDLLPYNWAQLERGRSLDALHYATSVHVMRDTAKVIAMDLDPFDAFLTPTLTQLPRPVGYWDMKIADYERYNALWTDAAYMFAFNISGLPAVSVPTAWTDDDIPIGTQFVGRFGDEATLLNLAAQIEAARPWTNRRPAICAGG